MKFVYWRRAKFIQSFKETRGNFLTSALSVFSKSLSPLPCCRHIQCVLYMMGGKKSRDKSRNEEHQKLSWKISPLVFYFKANNMKMRGVAAITAPWRQGYTAPEAAKQTSDAVRREICDDKETNDDAAEDKRVTERFLSFLFSFFIPLLCHKFKKGFLYWSRMYSRPDHTAQYCFISIWPASQNMKMDVLLDAAPCCLIQN